MFCGGLAGVVRDAGIQMKRASDPVSLILPDYGKTSRVCMTLNRAPDVDDFSKRFDRLDPDRQALESRLDEVAGCGGDLADHKRFGLIPVIPLHDRRDVDIDDVAGAEPIAVGDSVTDHFIDARADGLRVAFITQTGRLVPVLQGVLVGRFIQFRSRDPRPNQRTEEVHQLRVELPGGAHAGSFFLVQDDGLHK